MLFTTVLILKFAKLFDWILIRDDFAIKLWGVIMSSIDLAFHSFGLLLNSYYV